MCCSKVVTKLLIKFILLRLITLLIKKCILFQKCIYYKKQYCFGSKYQFKLVTVILYTMHCSNSLDKFREVIVSIKSTKNHNKK